MERAISPDTTALARKEGEQKEEKKPSTPDKENRRAISMGRSNVITRSAKKNNARDAAARVAGSTKQLRSSARSASCEQIFEVQDKPLLQKQDQHTAASAVLGKTEVKMEASDAATEVRNKVQEHANVEGEGTGGSIEKNEDNLKYKEFLSLKKKEVVCDPEETNQVTPAGIHQGDEAWMYNLQSEKKTECPITEPPTGSLGDVDGNIQSRITRNGVSKMENVTDYELNENEEERRKRIRLSQILESSSMAHVDQEISGMKKEANNNMNILKGAVDRVNVNDSSMIAGDAQEGYAKDYLTQNTEITGRGLETVGSQVSLPSTGNIEAGGDAGVDPQMQQYLDKPQTFREPTPECIQANQNVKREPAEKISKGTSIQKGELAYQVETSLIPIKPIPALNAVPSQENNSSLDNLNSVPYIPPDANMLYQPEAGIMKSKPVPKPTRGRRGRRRSPSLVTVPTGYRHFMHHPDLHIPEQARLVPRHPYHQRYMSPEFHPALPADYCEVVPGPDGEYVAYHGEGGGEVIGGGDVSNMPAISASYPVNRWYCGDEYFKMSRPLYTPRGRGRGSSGGRGRPRGRRGSGGVRQYLQHRLLWARYTGRSQDALDRVLSIINSKCGLQEDGSKEASGSRVWTAAEREGAVEGDLATRLDRGHERSASRADPGSSDTDPYCVYNRGAFSSNISNMMTAGGSSSTSILSQSGIGSNAVVDGNGYIVYLNKEDSTDYQQHPPIPFVPSESNLSDGGDSAAILERPSVRSGDVMSENDVKRSEEMTLPQETCISAESSTMVPNKLVTDGIPTGADANITEMGTTAETSAMAARIPNEGSRTPSGPNGGYKDQEKSNRTPGRKRTTPNGLKTPVSPIKEPKGSKRQSQSSSGRQKKKVRRSLTFSSPIKQEETLMATENIANALTNSGPSEPESAAGSTNSTADYLSSSSSTSTTLPSISNLLHSSTNAGISINIHVTNDANNKERSVGHTNSEDVVAGRMLQNTLDQSSKGTVHADVATRPGEGTPQLHYSVPRYTVEWHGDYHHPESEEGPVMDRAPCRYQEHVMPVPAAPNTTASRFRYPYRDPNNIHGYYSQHHPYPSPSSPLDRYYTADYAKEWSEMYTKYPSEHYPSGYEAQLPDVSTAYQAAQWSSGWGRNTGMFIDPYQKPASSRPNMELEMRDIPYSFYHKATAPYPRVQPGFPEEVYSQHPPHYGGYGGTSAMVSHHHAKERLVAAVPEVMQEARQPENNYESHRLHQPWAMASCTQGPQVLQEDSVGDLGPRAHSPQQLQPPVECGVQESNHQETGESTSQLPEEQSQM